MLEEALQLLTAIGNPLGAFGSAIITSETSTETSKRMRRLCNTTSNSHDLVVPIGGKVISPFTLTEHRSRHRHDIQ